MKNFFEYTFIRFWNWLVSRPAPVHYQTDTLDFGAAIVEERVTRRRVSISQTKRREHIAVLGMTGSGKSYFLRYQAFQDISEDRGFFFIDVHGDAAPVLMSRIAEEERRRRTDLSVKTIVVEPGDPAWSVGVNPLEHRPGEQIFVMLAEFVEILKRRWHLDHLGARTEELLRNALHVIADNHLTLLELAPLLTNEAFRAACLRNVTNQEVENYFRARYDQASEAMQAVYRDAVLNKLTAFTADPKFRHILGQRRSTFSLLNAIDNGFWVIVNLDKGRLGEQAMTFGSLLMTLVKNALFSRRSRSLVTLYCDEIQNFVSFASGLETLISEARKFGVGLASANQYLDQYPPEMRAAILSVGTLVFFQLVGSDAEKASSLLDGGKRLTELLKDLPKRNMVMKSGNERWVQAQVPTVAEPRTSSTDLHNRCRARWARRRTDIEAEIRTRSQQAARGTSEVLRGWQ